MKLLVLLVLSLLAGLSLAANNSTNCFIGNALQKNINTTDLQQVWYMGYINPKIFSVIFSCWRHMFARLPDGSYYAQSNTKNIKTLQDINVTGPVDVHNGRFFTVKFKETNDWNSEYEFVALNPKLGYYIADGCLPFQNNTKVQWISFNTRHPSPETKKAALDDLKKIGLNISDFGTYCIY